MLGGWDVTGVLLLQSGPFLTPFFSNGDPSGTGSTVRGFTSTQRPDSVGDGNLDEPDGRCLLRPERFHPASQQHRPLWQCRSRRRCIGPGTSVFSMTLGKRFSLSGRWHLRTEIAFSNLFNIENLDVNPSSLNITSSSFSRVTATQTVDQAGPRTIQFSLRVSF